MLTLNKEKYFQNIFEKFSNDIFRYVRLRISQLETVEDITSNVFIKYWQKLSTDSEIKNDRALLYTIARGLIIDEYRSTSHKKSVSLEDTDEITLTQNDNNYQELEVAENKSSLYSKLDLLKSAEKDLLLLYYIQELSIDEISKILKKTPGTIRVSIHRALNSLKKFYD